MMKRGKKIDLLLQHNRKQNPKRSKALEISGKKTRSAWMLCSLVTKKKWDGMKTAQTQLFSKKKSSHGSHRLKSAQTNKAFKQRLQSFRFPQSLHPLMHLLPSYILLPCYYPICGGGDATGIPFIPDCSRDPIVLAEKYDFFYYAGEFWTRPAPKWHRTFFHFNANKIVTKKAKANASGPTITHLAKMRRLNRNRWDSGRNVLLSHCDNRTRKYTARTHSDSRIAKNMGSPSARTFSTVARRWEVTTNEINNDQKNQLSFQVEKTVKIIPESWKSQSGASTLRRV